MGEQTKIQWTDATFNPWRGCSKVHAGCANCYAEKGAKRNPSVLGLWGPNGTRVVAAEKTWGEPAKWDKAAAAAGVRRRVFCASLADVFEDWQGPIVDHHGRELWRRECGSWVAGSDSCGLKDCDCEASRPLTLDDVRRRLFGVIDATPNLDWLLVTKRPENVQQMWPTDYAADLEEKYLDGAFCPVCNVRRPYGEGTEERFGCYEAAADQNGPETDESYEEPRSLYCSQCGVKCLPFRSNVWLLTSVSDQQTYDAAAPHLWRCRDLVPVLGFSAEPLLGPIKIHHEHDGQLVRNWAGCWDWWIVGGESGHGARPCDLSWIRSIVGQCEAAGVACFVKQLGAMPIQADWSIEDGDHRSDYPISDPKGGDWNEWPSDLRVREWPKGGE